MKKITLIIIIVLMNLFSGSAFSQKQIKVVTTLSVYADIAKYIGGEKVDVKYIVKGNQDAHFIRPRPSYAMWLRDADLYVDTGLDLELWSPALVDKSGNPKIRSGQPGYVAAATGIHLLEKPATADRSQGDVHIYGNPHIHTSPLNAEKIAENITAGLINISPENAEFFKKRLAAFKAEINKRLFGKELVKILGADILIQLAQSHQLYDFLEMNSFKGKKLIDYLGGWFAQMAPLRGKKLVAYHKNWAYFKDLFELDVVGYVEPKPGIPPSPQHVEKLIQKMEALNVKVILAANYFDERKVRDIAKRVGATPVIVPLNVGGVPEVQNYFQLIDYWISHLRQGFGLPA